MVVSSSATVVDIGGGDGTLLTAILKGNPQLRGVLADLPHVAEGAQRRFKTEGLADRCEIKESSAFTASGPFCGFYQVRYRRSRLECQKMSENVSNLKNISIRVCK
jgi:hypothetical protein